MIIIPLITFAAFIWDGIYIGATASRQMRDSMLWAVAAFAAVWAAGITILSMQNLATDVYDKAAMHILMAAYFAHLLARTIYMSCSSFTT